MGFWSRLTSHRSFHPSDIAHGIGTKFSADRCHGIGTEFAAERCHGIGTKFAKETSHGIEPREETQDNGALADK